MASYEWANRAPSEVTWTGLTAGGTPYPDGTYSYAISATDKGGNSTTVTVEGITLSTQAAILAVLVSPQAFSPNGDGKQDTLSFQPAVPEAEGVDRWTLTVYQKADKGLRVFSGNGQVPQRLVFDGTDKDGNFLPEGSYKARIIDLLEPANMATFMTRIFPQMMDAMPVGMKPMMLSMKHVPGGLAMMEKMMPLMFPAMAPGILGKVMPDMIREVEDVHRRDAGGHGRAHARPAAQDDGLARCRRICRSSFRI